MAYSDQEKALAAEIYRLLGKHDAGTSYIGGMDEHSGIDDDGNLTDEDLTTFDGQFNLNAIARDIVLWFEEQAAENRRVIDKALGIEAAAPTKS